MNALALTADLSGVERRGDLVNGPALRLIEIVSHRGACDPLSIAAIRFVRDHFSDRVLMATSAIAVPERRILVGDGLIIDRLDHTPISDLYMLSEGGVDAVAWLHQVPGSRPTKVQLRWPDKIANAFVVPARRLAIQGRIVGRIFRDTWRAI